MPKPYYPITQIKRFSTPQGRGSCYQQFAGPGPHGDGKNRFAVIFDEDIDSRVFDRLDAIYKIAGTLPLPDILMIGERKGSLTIVLRKPHPLLADAEKLENLLPTMSSDGDFWSVRVFTVDETLVAYGQYLAHPALKYTAFLEATTWEV